MLVYTTIHKSSGVGGSAVYRGCSIFFSISRSWMSELCLSFMALLMLLKPLLRCSMAYVVKCSNPHGKYQSWIVTGVHFVPPCQTCSVSMEIVVKIPLCIHRCMEFSPMSDTCNYLFCSYWFVQRRTFLKMYWWIIEEGGWIDYMQHH